MKNLLTEIMDELDGMTEDEIKEPEDEVAEGETIVGTLDLHHRKLYTLMCRLSDEFERLCEQGQAAMDAGDEAKANSLRAPAITAKRKHEALNNLFWSSVIQVHDLTDKSTVIVRKGWQVGWAEEEECDCPTCTLKRALGLG